MPQLMPSRSIPKDTADEMVKTKMAQDAAVASRRNARGGGAGADSSLSYLGPATARLMVQVCGLCGGVQVWGGSDVLVIDHCGCQSDL